MNKFKKKNGFTTIELLLVVAIIIIIISASVVSYININKKQKQKDYDNMKENIQTASEIYLNDNEDLREALIQNSLLTIKVSDLIKGGYIEEYYTTNPKTNESIVDKCVSVVLGESGEYVFQSVVKECGNTLVFMPNILEIKDNVYNNFTDSEELSNNIVFKSGVTAYGNDNLPARNPSITIYDTEENDNHSLKKADINNSNNRSTLTTIFYKYNNEYYERTLNLLKTKKCTIKYQETIYAQLNEGESYNLSNIVIPNPQNENIIIVGFETTNGENLNVGNFICKYNNSDNLDEEITPIFGYNEEIKYIVKSYLQNINDSEYTLNSTNTYSNEKTTEEINDMLTNGELDKIGFTLNLANTIIEEEYGIPVINAYYDRKKYTLTFNPNGGKYNGSTSNVVEFLKYESSKTFIIPTRDSYSFLGWCEGTSDTCTQYVTNTSVTENKTYTAKWQVAAFTVTLDKQSGTGGTASVSATYGSAMPAVTVPTRVGHTFNGYYTSTGGGGTQYYTASGTSAKNWDIMSNTTLYAYWTVNSVTVTLNKQSGSGGTASVSATYGSAMPNISIPSRTYYKFNGYYTSTGGGGTQYYTASGTSTRNSTFTSATTLYAYWTSCGSTATCPSGSTAYTSGWNTYCKVTANQDGPYYRYYDSSEKITGSNAYSGSPNINSYASEYGCDSINYGDVWFYKKKTYYCSVCDILCTNQNTETYLSSSQMKNYYQWEFYWSWGYGNYGSSIGTCISGSNYGQDSCSWFKSAPSTSSYCKIDSSRAQGIYTCNSYYGGSSLYFSDPDTSYCLYYQSSSPIASC